MSQPTPDERLRERLAHLPDACRALLAALDRQQLRGGGAVDVRLEVGATGGVVAVVLETRYEGR
jgi:hypothetical protein